MPLQILLSLLLLESPLLPQRDSLLLLCWNLENFFDWKDEGGGAADREFSSRGARRWTHRRFQAKCDAAAKAILWIGDRYGRVPDIVAVEEVENRKVLAELLRSTPLRKLGYDIVHYDSPDRRGIDVALLYRKSVFRLARSVPLSIPGIATRDILLVQLEGADTLAVLVNHHPSKYGGAASAPRREAAVARLKGACDSLRAAGQRRIICCGDFNDTPDQQLFTVLTDTAAQGGCPLRNLAAPLAAAGQGTIRFDGRWEMIDLFFTTPEVGARMEIVRIPWLLTRDTAHPGEKPLRTWSGPRWIGGVSDHCPVVLRFAAP